MSITATPPLERVLRRVEEVDGCWLWTGYLTPQGYGTITINSRAATGKKKSVHHVTYEAIHGPIPEGMHLDHVCHTVAVALGECAGGPSCTHRRCVRPDHLEPVTPAENAARGAKALATHCVNGHEFTEENTYRRPNSDGRTPQRQCRECHRIAHRWPRRPMVGAKRNEAA